MMPHKLPDAPGKEEEEDEENSAFFLVPPDIQELVFSSS